MPDSFACLSGSNFLQLILGIWQGFWLFPRSPIDAWWLSVSAIFLNASWSLHNVIAWMKIRPFLPRTWSLLFIGTVILVQPYWVVEIYASTVARPRQYQFHTNLLIDFTYFHGINNIFRKTRPWEALCRDPWWIFTTLKLFWVIKKQYDMTLKEIIRISPRFGIMLASMVISIIFIVCDVLSVTGALHLPGTTGINPFWKLAFVFKCLTDTIVLDDFKTALDRLRAFKISRLGSFSQDNSDRRTRNRGSLVATWEQAERDARKPRHSPPMPSPDGDYVHSSNFPGFKPKPKPREMKDSVVSPDKALYPPSDRSLNPEDIVPSAIEEQPLSSMQAARHPEKKQDEWIDDLDLRDVGHLAEERDYAQALRDLESSSQPSSPSKSSSFPRRSLPP